MKKLCKILLSILVILSQRNLKTDGPTPCFQKTIEGRYGVISLCFMPDGNKLICRGSNVQIWDMQSTKLHQPIKGLELGIPTLHVTDDGKFITFGNWLSNIVVFNVDTEKSIKLNYNKYRATSLARSHSGKYIAIGFDDGTMHLGVLDPEQNLKLVKAHKHKINQVAFSSNEQYLASASDDGLVKIWSLEGCLVDQAYIPFPLLCVAFSPNSEQVAFAGQDENIVYKTIGMPELISLTGSKHTSCIAFSPDGRYIIAGSRDQTLSIWDSKNNKLVQKINPTGYPISSLALSPDGTYLAIGDKDGNVVAWCFADFLLSDQNIAQASSAEPEAKSIFRSMVRSLSGLVSSQNEAATSARVFANDESERRAFCH